MASASWIGSWRPGIGDASLTGWLVFCAYLATAWLCWRARRFARQEALSGARHHSAKVWSALAIGLVALGLNKQLDLQSGLTALGRHLAKAQGWYENRRPVEAVFVGLVLLSVVVGLVWLLRQASHDARRLMLALLGAAGLCAFVALRAVEFHHTTSVVGIPVLELRANWILELICIALIAVGALTYRRSDS